MKPALHLAHVEHVDVRQAAPVDAARQLHAGEPLQALRARCRTARQQHGAAAARSLLGHLTRVVAGVALVLVGALVLLVHHDQADVFDGSEHGRARPDADARLALAQAAPLRVALRGAQLRVEHRDGLAEAVDEAPDDLRRERDLRDQHDHAAALI